MRGCVLILAGCAALVLYSCDGGKVVKNSVPIATIDSISAEALDALAGKRIFFGHQSVGWNIIDGLRDVAMQKARNGFNFVEAREIGSKPGFYHAGIGSNGDPLGKIADFEAIIRGGMGGKVDIAFMKLCYVDVVAGTDVATVFAAYLDAMNRLDAEYPGTTFVRVTVPLMVDQRDKGFKPFVKRLLGRPVRDDGNLERQWINDMIRADCSNSGRHLYDLAKIESVASDGSRITLTKSGESYYTLRDEYSSDGGHLNEKGRQSTALELLSVLSMVDSL